MPENRKALTELMTGLKQQRDDLAVRIHLAGTEAKGEWSKVEDKFNQLCADYEPVKDATKESAQDLVASLALVASEVKSSFDRIRASLK